MISENFNKRIKKCCGKNMTTTSKFIFLLVDGEEIVAKQYQCSICYSQCYETENNELLYELANS